MSELDNSQYFEDGGNTCIVPRVYHEFPLTQTDRDTETEILLSTHVDSIQAILLTLEKHRGEDLYIKGRCVDEEGQVMDIMTNEVYEIFASRTSDRHAALHMASQRMGSDIGRLVIRTESGLDKNFPCKYYDGDQLVEDWLSGRVTANHLMPVFGGVTALSIGSNALSRDELEAVGTEISGEISRYQVNGAVLLGS